MLNWFRQLDEILRGDATQPEALRDGRIKTPAAGLLLVIVLLGLVYGACAGSFAMIRTAGENYPQLIASTLKLPMLFLLTLIFTFPSLYVFNALLGSRLSILSVFRLLVSSLGVMLAVLASLGPIVVFFGISTTSYTFMVLLNVVMSSVAGILGLAFLLRTLHRLVVLEEPVIPIPAETPPRSSNPDCTVAPEEAGEQGHSSGALTHVKESKAALDSLGQKTGPKAKAVFRLWVAVFALVGAQMSWILRPFVGDPALPFEWFRQREGNFFIAVLGAVRNLFGG